jgi:hypothetical protein
VLGRRGRVIGACHDAISINWARAAAAARNVRNGVINTPTAVTRARCGGLDRQGDRAREVLVVVIDVEAPVRGGAGGARTRVPSCRRARHRTVATTTHGRTGASGGALVGTRVRLMHYYLVVMRAHSSTAVSTAMNQRHDCAAGRRHATATHGISRPSVLLTATVTTTRAPITPATTAIAAAITPVTRHEPLAREEPRGGYSADIYRYRKRFLLLVLDTIARRRRCGNASAIIGAAPRAPGVTIVRIDEINDIRRCGGRRYCSGHPAAHTRA